MTDRPTIHDLVAEEAGAIIARGERPPVPELMEQVLAAHPEIAIDLRIFAGMCQVAMRHAAERQNAEADELARELERRRRAANDQ